MLTEGWDANNVTHILGIRAFGSQLLCEQVVGRGLRRMDYDARVGRGRQRELLKPEYVDVYGIPFSVIPFKGRTTNQPAPEDKPKNRVWALPEREEMEIRFPIVEGYVFQTTKGLLRCDVDKIEPLAIDPKPGADRHVLRPTAGYLDTQQAGVVPVRVRQQDRDAPTTARPTSRRSSSRSPEDHRRPARSVDGEHRQGSRVMRLQSRHQLFPQVFGFVQEYIQRKVNFNGVDRRELGLEKYMRLMVERLRDAIVPDERAGEPPLMPILNRYRPIGSTTGVDFMTTRPTSPSTRATSTRWSSIRRGKPTRLSCWTRATS